MNEFNKNELDYAVSRKTGKPLIFRGIINLPFVAYIMLDYANPYGNQFIANVNGAKTGLGLPVLKALSGLDVGKFYKITRLAEVDKGKYKFYPYEVEEITEAEYMELAPVYKEMETELTYDTKAEGVTYD